MKIIKIQKLKQNKYKIILDNETIDTFDNVILKYNLLYKKELTNEELKKIISESNYYNIYNKTLNYSIKKIRSEKEIKKYLDKFDISDYEKSTIVEKLKNLNFINDINYCKAFINDKIYLSKYGIDKIKKMLLEQEIDINIINSEISKIDIERVHSNLEYKIRRKIDSNHKYSNYKLKDKLLNYFINEGYNKEDILYYLDKYQKEDNHILKHEFDKLYLKYISRYDKSMAIIKLKQKLIQEGFSIEKINILLQEKTEE